MKKTFKALTFLGMSAIVLASAGAHADGVCKKQGDKFYNAKTKMEYATKTECKTAK